MEDLGKKGRVRTENDRMLIEKDAIREREAEYFRKLLNLEEDWELEMVVLGRERGLNVLGELNEALIVREEM